MIIKSAYKPPVILSIYSNFTLLIFGILSVILFIVWGQIAGLIAGLLGLIILVFSIKKDHKRQGVKLADYTKKLKVNFECPKCKENIKAKVDHDDIDGLPLIYTCKTCEVMWHVGNHVRST